MAKQPRLATLCRRMAAYGARPYLGSVWALEGAACVGDVEAGAEGFPVDVAVRKMYPTKLRVWLRDPAQHDALLEGLKDMIEARYTAPESKGKRG